MSLQGSWRSYVTPPLPGGRSLSYEIRARWRDQGGDVERIAQVPIHAGDRVTVDFTKEISR
jgi:uncharacterized protein (TIGR03000 family)